MKATADVPIAIPQVSRILVATDFSVQARNALEWAHRLADAFGAKLVLFHVINIFSLAEMGCAMEGGTDPLGLVREQSQNCIAELKSKFPDIETIVREGAPRPMIVDAAGDLNCQMIVMGTHGRSGLAHLLLGSVAEYVVRHSSVPVLTVRLRQK